MMIMVTHGKVLLLSNILTLGMVVEMWLVVHEHWSGGTGGSSGGGTGVRVENLWWWM